MKLLHIFALTAAWLSCAVASVSWAQDPPASLEHDTGKALEAERSSLEPLERAMDDEQAFMRALAAFEKLHMAAARLAYQEARERQETGATAESEEALTRMREHLGLVKSAYQLGLSRYDSNAILQNHYGDLLYDYLGDPHTAMRHWTRAAELDKKYAAPHNSLGMYYFHNGMYALGLESMDKALRLDPKNPDYLFNMAQVYLIHYPQLMPIRKWDAARIYKEAMKLSATAAKLRPDDYEMWKDYAMNFFAAERFKVKPDWAKAVQAWQKARDLARNDDERFNALLYEARVHIRSNNPQKARPCLEAALTLLPDNQLARQMLDNLDP